MFTNELLTLVLGLTAISRRTSTSCHPLYPVNNPHLFSVCLLKIKHLALNYVSTASENFAVRQIQRRIFRQPDEQNNVNAGNTWTVSNTLDNTNIEKIPEKYDLEGTPENLIILIVSAAKML